MGKGMGSGKCAMFVRGSALAVWVYLAVVAVLALLVVNGIIPERAEVGIVSGAGFVAALIGGMVVAGRGAWGRFPAAMINSAIFAGVLVVVKMMGGTPVLWRDCGWLQLVCIFAGGAVSGLWRDGKKKRGKRVNGRTHLRGRA